MPNTVLTPSIILKEAGRVFHQKANFLKTVDWNYDDRFARSGAKAGSTISLRDAVEFTVSDGATMSLQDVIETKQDLTIGTQKHVAFSCSAVELTMSIDDYSKRYIEPAMARLAATIEGLFIADVVKKIPNMVDGDTASFAFTHAAQAKQRLDEALAPPDNRNLCLCPKHHTQYLTDTKGLYVPGGKIGAQYSDGIVQDALGFNVLSSTHLGAPQATGTAAKTTGYATNGATQTGAAITLKTGTTTFKAGDIVTFAGSNAVHPETKADLGYLKQFTVTADYAGGAGNLAIFPPVVLTGGKQNVSQAIADSSAVVKVGAGASETMVQSIAYPKDAFVFATADLEDPSKYGRWGAVEVMDGLSMRIWRDAVQASDTFPTRIDVFCGWLARYPNKAARIHADG